MKIRDNGKLLSENVDKALDYVLEELDQNAAGPELDSAKELENVATDERDPKELEPATDNKDVYSDDEHKQEEDVEGVVVKEEELEKAPIIDDTKEVIDDVKDADKDDDDDDEELEKEDDELEKEDDSDEEDEKEDDDKDEEKLDESDNFSRLMSLISSINESLSQNAAGPELDAAKELNNEATEERDGKDAAPSEDNKDVYPADEHKEAEEVEGVVVEGFTDKLNSAASSIYANKYGTRALAKEEEKKNGNLKKYVAPVVLTILGLPLIGGILAAVRYKKNKEIISAKEEEIRAAIEKNPKAKAIASKIATEAEKPTPSVETLKNLKLQLKDALKADGILRESFIDYIFDEQNFLNESDQLAAGPELDAAKELDNEATEERDPKEVAPSEDNKYVYPADEHKEAEEVEGVVIKETERDDAILVDAACDSTDSAVKDYNRGGSVIKPAAKDNKKTMRESEQNAAGPELDAAKELDNEATVEKEPDAKPEEKKNTDVYCDDCHDQQEDTDGVVVESEQNAAGPELDAAKELDNEATEERNPKEMTPDEDNKDVYTDDEHKQVEDVVGVVIEAARRCKAKNKPGTKANICEEALALFEEEGIAPKVGDPADKEYDADADIESAEMNGDDTNRKDYEDIQGERSDAAKAEESVVEPSDLHESKAYTSLREACALDEDYFTTDSYTVQTATEKQVKLAEQVSLLIAKENFDPMYDELLKESLYCKRLQEALINKYSNIADERIDLIINK